MPLYEFYNEEIKEQYELMMTYDNKVKYLKKNPHIKEIIGAPKIVGGVGDRVKTDDGFKEVLSKIGENHKGSHLHKKSAKEIKTKEIVKKHIDIQSRK
tara:strand:+ start:11250 stop:11543 length:294 start_codon:yes stop_codon:yes gene_type:complete